MKENTYGPRGYASPGEGLTPPPGVSLTEYIWIFVVASLLSLSLSYVIPLMLGTKYENYMNPFSGFYLPTTCGNLLR